MRFKGNNLADVISWIFDDYGMHKPHRDAYRQKLKYFDQELRDSEFDRFYKMINV